MSFKKYLRTSRKGWSFIEYAVIFTAVAAAVVISFELVRSTTTDSGRIQRLFRAKTDGYIGAMQN